MKKLLCRRESPHLKKKIGLKMKLSVLLFFSTFLSIQANESYSQETPISLELANVTVERLLETIESNTEFKFVYKIKDVDLNRKVTIQVEEVTIDKILDQLFKDSKTGYKILDRQVFLLTKSQLNKPKAIQLLQSNFGYKRVIPFLADTIRGKVTDDLGVPLIGVNIQVQ